MAVVVIVGQFCSVYCYRILLVESQCLDYDRLACLLREVWLASLFVYVGFAGVFVYVFLTRFHVDISAAGMLVDWSAFVTFLFREVWLARLSVNVWAACGLVYVVTARVLIDWSTCVAFAFSAYRAS